MHRRGVARVSGVIMGATFCLAATMLVFKLKYK